MFAELTSRVRAPMKHDFQASNQYMPEQWLWEEVLEFWVLDAEKVYKEFVNAITSYRNKPNKVEKAKVRRAAAKIQKMVLELYSRGTENICDAIDVNVEMYRKSIMMKVTGLDPRDQFDSWVD